MAVCECCGKKYSKSEAESEFREYLQDDCWTELFDEAMGFFNSDYCFECNKENMYDNIREYDTCDDCGHLFHPEDAEEEFDEHICNEFGFNEDILYLAREYFHDIYCGKCNIKSFEECKDEFEEEYEDRYRSVDEDFELDEEESSGPYRTYDEYLASGGPIDPAADALWLHDQA